VRARVVRARVVRARVVQVGVAKQYNEAGLMATQAAEDSA